MPPRLLALAALLTLTACSTVATYERVPKTGRFSGEPRMVALAPNTFFFYQPKQDARFAFTTHRRDDEALAKKGGRGHYDYRKEWRIEPGEMITTGASVPRSLWQLPGFAAFDFTRAALIHDWLYEAHHRFVMAEEGYKAALQTGDRAALRKHAHDKQRYGDYADISQNDAADIFAECIKVTMEESKVILEGFDRLNAQDAGNGATLAGLKDALRYNRPHPRTLTTYHYFVSDDCVVKTSKQIWEKHGSDVAIYRVLTSPEVRQHAKKHGYLSDWLFERFELILKEEEKRDAEYQKAKRTLGLSQNTPPPAAVPAAEAVQQAAPSPVPKTRRRAGG